MAKAKYYEVTGPVKWARLNEGNVDMGFEGNWEEFGGKHTINLCVDEESKKIIEDSGTAGTFREDNEGDEVFRFTRKVKGPFAAASGPPKVVFENGTSWDYDVDGPIGNGSVCKIRFCVYPTKLKPGTRMEKVTILDFIPYISDEDVNDEVPV